MHKKFGKNRAYGSGIRRYLRGQTDRQTDRQTTTQTDRLITILCNRFRGRSNNKHYSWWSKRGLGSIWWNRSQYDCGRCCRRFETTPPPYKPWFFYGYPASWDIV